MPVRVAVLGATGRMGRTVISNLESADDLSFVGGWAAKETLPLDDKRYSADLAEILAGADVAIDFTLASVTDAVIDACRNNGCALVSGTTGLSEATRKALTAAAKEIVIVHDHNMSSGVHVLTELVRLAASRLPEFEIEIVEAHHRDKRDAPSGTAIKLGEAAAESRGVKLDDVAIWQRHGEADARAADAIGFSAIRAGAIVGEHQVSFISDTETLRLEHIAHSRGVFAAGALRAARWAATAKAGRIFGVADVLTSETE